MTAETHRYVKRGFVHSPHGNIEYRESGDGPAVLFIHGTPQSSAQMVGVFRNLQDGYRCVAMSTMGYGDSDRPPEPYTTMHEYAQAAVWVLDGLSIEKTVVMGTHTGAGIALCLAADWPERVSAAILEEPFNWSTPARLRAMASAHTPIAERGDGGHGEGGRAPKYDAHGQGASLLTCLPVVEPTPLLDLPMHARRTGIKSL